MAINRVATTAINQSSSQVARETRVRRKLVKERSRLKRGHGQKSECKNYRVTAVIFPVIKLGDQNAGASFLRTAYSKPVSHRYTAGIYPAIK
ncbi:phage tail protein [Escherichia coli]|uniref:phage tail protein n=1 Tax=Escherichia coli TaxID=562 RepID=UPI0039816C35